MTADGIGILHRQYPLLGVLEKKALLTNAEVFALPTRTALTFNIRMEPVGCLHMIDILELQQQKDQFVALLYRAKKIK